MPIDYETELAPILRAIEELNLTATVTRFIIEATPGPVDKHINTKLSETLKSLLRKSPFKLEKLEPFYPYTEIIIKRR